MVGMLLRHTNVRVHFRDSHGSCMVEKAFLHGVGSFASIPEPMIWVIFDQAIIYFLLFQPRRAALLSRAIRLICVGEI